MSNDKKKNSSGTLAGIFAIEFGMIAYATMEFGSIERVLSNPFMLIFLGAVLIAGLSVYSSQASAEKSEQAEKNKSDKIYLYKECVRLGIYELNSPQRIEKAKLIAQSRNIPFKDIQILFNECRRLVEDDDSEKLQKTRQMEMNLKRQLEKYAEYTGRDKAITMLTDEKADCLAKADALKRGVNSAITLSQQKEQDWAILSGIANGLGGAGAAIGTAVDVQVKNAQIRAQNQANLKAMGPSLANALNKEIELRKKAELMDIFIRHAKSRFVAEMDMNSVFEKVAISTEKLEITESGSIMITASAKLKQEFYVFDNCRGSVDGTIKASVFDENREIGSALLVAPNNGIAGITYSSALHGIALCNGQKDKTYTVQYTPYKLWAMEQ